MGPKWRGWLQKAY